MQQNRNPKTDPADIKYLIRSCLLIRGALHRIKEDDYGYCVQCGEDINPKRLDVNPCVIKCINCAT
ncbi:TraR/DksA family transcriptional regulator [Providencia huaxiensis]|uniref:TraR/DksA family transcriptional regulator n=1 Tax=Morganellaceae TaxID=1903414 RepID=UPI0022A38179|nr:TraR/DksA C4-type zinc finger protein [Proteus mirabilis]HCT9449315.1 TraR/DksA C4-type zinc finger protein [Proteus mirabilis]